MLADQDYELMLGQALASARTKGREIDPVVFHVRPAQAPRILDVAAIAFGGPVEGRVLTGTTARTRRQTGCERPVWAPMFASARLDDGGALEVNPSLLGIGVELHFRFGRPYPTQDDDPSRLEEIADAIVSCHVGFQILGRRFGQFLPMTRPAAIADFALAAFHVRGPTLDWRRLALGDLRFELIVDGHPHVAGRGADLMGHPLEALSHLAARLQRSGAWFDAGSFVSTGSCTGVHPLVPGHALIGQVGNRVVSLLTA